MNKILASALAILGGGAIAFVTKKLIHCVKVAKMNEKPETVVVEPEIVDPQEPISESETVVEVNESTNNETGTTEEMK